MWPFGEPNAAVMRAPLAPTDPSNPLSRIQPESFELLAPFCRRITKSLYSNTAWQTTFDRSAHEVWGEER